MRYDPPSIFDSQGSEQGHGRHHGRTATQPVFRFHLDVHVAGPGEVGGFRGTLCLGFGGFKTYLGSF